MVRVKWFSVEDRAQLKKGNPSSTARECGTLVEAAKYVMEHVDTSVRESVTIRDGLRLIELPEIERLYASAEGQAL